MASVAVGDRLQSGSQASTPYADRLAQLKLQFPCREHTIGLLADELKRTGSLGEICLVYGPPATGKTAVVRGLLTSLQLRHAYINCNESTRVRPVLCSVLHQLKGGKRQREDGYECSIKCDSISDFRLHLSGVVGRRRSPCWVVLDNADRLAGSDLLSALMNVRADTSSQVCFILIGKLSWTCGRYLRDTVNVLPPKDIHLACYQPPELQKIMEHRRQQALGGCVGDAPAYRQFLTSFVPSFCRASNNLLDLQAAVGHLFPLYMQPLREGHQMQSHALYNRIKQQVQQVVHALQLQQRGGAAQQLAAAAAAAAAAGGGGAGEQQAATVAGRRASSSGLAFELPYISKFLLLAAYIASRNRPTSDRTVFDPTFKKRGRKDAQAHDRQVEAAVVAKLRGPHGFPLERLLHIFYAIYANHDADDDDVIEGGEAAGEEHRQQAQRVMQQCEVLQQVSSLVALRLLDQSSGDVLEGQVYRCNLGEEMAAALGANVRLRLTDYLKLS